MLDGMQKYWISLRSSLWFVPALMVAGSIGLAIGLIQLDVAFDIELARRWPKLFGLHSEGARGIMEAIATSMVTVTGVTFSVMIVALSLASNQYSPRILRNFMQDTGTKLVLGIFVGVFVYSLIVLRVIRGGEDGFVPPVAILGGILLSLASVGFLVYFVHHIATEIQAATIVEDIAQETIESLEEIYPTSATWLSSETRQQLSGLERQTWTPVCASCSGYLQSVGAGLARCAHKYNVVVCFENKVGSFVVADTALASVAGRANEKALKEIRRFFGINSYRTIDQDPDFGIRQLVDISLKALSPGINDTSTAINCIDRIGEILHRLVQRYNPAPACLYQGRVRVIWKHLSIEHLIDQAYHQIRQNASNNPAVIMRLLRTIGDAATVAVEDSYRKVLRKHVDLLEEVANKIQCKHDENVILERAGEVRRKLQARYS